MQITDSKHRLGAALLRVTAGVIMLWAGLEKLIGTPGGFSAAGFLKFGTAGTLAWPFVTGEPAEDAVFNPTRDFWVGVAGNDGVMSLINVLVVVGEISIGVCLVLGLLTRFAAGMGALMMAFFFLAAWNFAYGVVNQHLTYLVIFLTVAGLGAGGFYGLDAMLGSSDFAARNGWFRRWFLSGDSAATTAA